MQNSVPLVDLWRGPVLESRHLGAAVICDDTGQIKQAWGNPTRIILPRSSCKMIQALPLITLRWLARPTMGRIFIFRQSANGWKHWA